MTITKRIRWFVSGVRCRLNRQDWHMIMSYDEETKKEENVALVWFDPRSGSLEEVHQAAAAPEMLEALRRLDAWWTESFPGGPGGDRSHMGGIATLSDDTCNIWRSIREAINHAEGKH